MRLTRRQLLKAGALAAAVPAVGAALTTEQAQELPESFKELKPLGDRARPITTEEFQQRVAQAQRLMREAKPRFAAVYLAPGSSLYYYTGIRWSGGERLFSLVIPATGEPLVGSSGCQSPTHASSQAWLSPRCVTPTSSPSSSG